MNETLLSILRCPYSGKDLVEKDGALQCGNRRYPVVDGIPQLLEPERIAEIDKMFQKQYTEETARKYDRAIYFSSLLIGCREPLERRRLTRRLDLRPGCRVLEVSTGTGANLPYIDRLLEGKGEIIALDLSGDMMKVARKRAAKLKVPVSFIQGDAVFLPFADDSFDAVLHFGGINMFGNIRRALAEMTRVARTGATLVVSDEGLSERRRATFLGRVMGKMNSLNLCRPPFAELPWGEISNFQLHWLWRECFYLFKFTKGALAAELVKEEDVRSEIRNRVGLS